MVIQPHLKEMKLKEGEQLASLDILSLITYESNGDLQLYSNCFNESMRMQPPV